MSGNTHGREGAEGSMDIQGVREVIRSQVCERYGEATPTSLAHLSRLAGVPYTTLARLLLYPDSKFTRISRRTVAALAEALSINSRIGEDQGHLLRARDSEILSGSTIKLSQGLLREFKELIEGDHNEEVYQQFLKDNPVLIDPLASTVIPKQKLGLEFITDFVIRKYDRRYLLVEIEKPQDRLFTEANDFTAGFTHAVGQVLDFQQWIDQNIAYAQKQLPGISSPKGLLIMGRRTMLTEKNAEKLHRYCANSMSVDVLTFDDLLLLATNLYTSLHGGHEVI